MIDSFSDTTPVQNYQEEPPLRDGERMVCETLILPAASFGEVGEVSYNIISKTAAVLFTPAMQGSSTSKYEPVVMRTVEDAEGKKRHDIFPYPEKDPSLFKKDYSKECEDFRELMSCLKELYEKKKYIWQAVAKEVKGVSEETTTGVHRLYQMLEEKKLLFPAINVNDSVTKSKFDNIYGCRHSLSDGIKRAMDVLMSGKTAMVCGYGDVGKGSAESLRNEKAIVMVSEVDPICALQACMAGYRVCTVEDALPYADIYITTTGNCNIITAEHMSKMKDQAIVGNIGHFDNEIEVDKLEKLSGIKKEQIKGSECPVDKYTFPDGHSIYLLARGRLLNLSNATGHPSFVMSNSFTNQVLAQIRLWEKQHELGVYMLSKDLDEEVARLHLEKLGAKLTKLRPEQAKYIGVKVEGPYKSEHYRY